jgi:hypothetical protein
MSTQNQNKTFSTIHNGQIEKFDNDQQNISVLNDELHNNNVLLSYQKDLPSCEKDYKLIYTLGKRNNVIKQQIIDIPEEYNNYFLKNGELLLDHEKKKNSNLVIRKVSIQDIFSKDEINSKKNKMNNYKKYLSNVDPSYVFVEKEYITDENYCKECKQHRIQDSTEARMICEKCGSEMTIMLYANKPSLKDPPPDVRYYEYKRFGHFCDWLCNLQGNGNQVPYEIIKVIRYEINRSRIKDLNCLNESHIKAYLKKYKHLGYDKYSNHSTQILCRSTGIEQISISPETIEDLKTLFPLIQDSWDKHKPKERSNFSSYSYIIFKFCQLLGCDELKSKLKLLKDKFTIYKLDRVWKKICLDMGGKDKGWVFIPTYG